MFFLRGRKGAAPVTATDPKSDAAAILTDELGLHHLWYLELRLQHELARSARVASVFSLAAWQIHLLPGERMDPNLPARSAALITKRLRIYDVVARVDGERIVALLYDAQFEAASTVAYRLKGDLQLKVPSAGRWQAGVATFGRDGVDAESLIQATLGRLDEDARAA